MFYKTNNINFYSNIQGEPLEVQGINRELGIHTYEGKFIVTDVKTGAKVVESSTKAKVIKELLKIKDEIGNIDPNHEKYLVKELDRLADYQTYEKYKQIFSDTFGHDILTFCSLIVLNVSNRIKLDICRFDEFFKYELKYHNMSLKDWIKDQYGDRVLAAVEYFL